MSRRFVYGVALSLTLVAALVLINSRLQTSGAQDRGLRRLDFDPATGNLSIEADGVPLSTILGQLRAKHRIEVAVPDMTEQSITVKVDAPLAEALARLLPGGTRFHFTAEGRELKMSGQTGDKKYGRPEPKDGRLTTKEQAPPLAADQIRVGKPAPDKVKAVRTDGRRGTKGFPTKVEIPPGVGPKKPLPTQGERDRYARLMLSINQRGDVRVLQYLEVRGTLIQPTTIDGDLVYVVSADDKVLAVGSVTDPLVVHSYLKDDKGHSNGRAESGDFVISLPEMFLDARTLGRTTISFYFLSPTESLPDALTPQTFEKFKEYLKPAGRVGGRELLAAYAKRNERRAIQ
jgi:hypothetical protein